MEDTTNQKQVDYKSDHSEQEQEQESDSDQPHPIRNEGDEDME